MDVTLPNVRASDGTLGIRGGNAMPRALVRIGVADLSRIESKPDVCGGKAVIRGTRVLVRNVLSMVGAGHSRQEVLASYPGLIEADIDAAFAYAIELVNEVNLVTDAA